MIRVSAVIGLLTASVVRRDAGYRANPERSTARRIRTSRVESRRCVHYARCSVDCGIGELTRRQAMVRTGILFVLTSLVAFAQSGTFTATGNMSVPRQGH